MAVDNITSIQNAAAIAQAIRELTSQIIINNETVLTVPPVAATTKTLDEDDLATGLLVTSATTVTITIPLDASDDLVSGFIVTLAVTHSGGQIDIEGESGSVTIVNFGTGETGDQVIDGIGIATLWKIGANSWAVHGTNVVAQ